MFVSTFNKEEDVQYQPQDKLVEITEGMWLRGYQGQTRRIFDQGSR